MKSVGFYPGEFLLPRCDLTKWSVVACDQFTSQPEYWDKVEEITGDAPSAYKMIFPEARLETENFDKKIAEINQTMEQYLKEGLFESYSNAMIYVERTLLDGSIRHGILGLLDLEEYDYQKGSGSLIRATEGTVLERIPPRVRIREHAPLEMPHILVLVDDPQRTVVEPLQNKTNTMQTLYDFELMQNGGRIRGWLVDSQEQERICDALAVLKEQETFSKRYNIADAPVLLYAVGDGNHSLASAKECWNQIKKGLSPEEAASHPARFAMVELGNLHDDSLKFEAIHRAVFGVKEQQFLDALHTYAASCHGNNSPQTVTIITSTGEETISIPHPDRTLAVGSIQTFLDEYLSNHSGKVDYIHGEQVVRELAAKGAIGILLPVMEKSQLFPTVILEGALPRKTFSMGEAPEKRYYLECRRLQNK